MRVERFEDLIAWQKARELFRLINKLASNPPMCTDYAVRNQITRASLSVMSNIAEGFDRGGDKEFVQYLYVSKGSCSEVRSQLYAIKDAGYLEGDQFENIFNLAEEISRILQGLIKSLKNSPKKGRKFHSEN